MNNENIKNYLVETVKTYLKKNSTFPAIGVGIVLKDGSIITQVDGVRKKGTSHKSQQDDIFALGSIGKPLTGYLFAKIATSNSKFKSKGFNTTIGEIFDDLLKAIEKSHKKRKISTANVNHYRNVTVAQLMAHISGMDYAPRSRNYYPKNHEALLSVFGTNIIAKRQLYTIVALEDQPYTGEGWNGLIKYSGGAIVVASMIERVFKESYETLLAEKVFKPLGITQYRFNGTSEDLLGIVTGTQQHRLKNGKYESHGILPSDNTHLGKTHAPAGNPNMSMQDFGKWIKAVVHGNKSNSSKFIFNQYFGLVAGSTTTSGGWAYDGKFLWHTGSQGWNYSIAEINRQDGYGVYAFTNIANDISKEYLGKLEKELLTIPQIYNCFKYAQQGISNDLLTIATNKASSGRHYIKPPKTGPFNLYKSANTLPIMSISFSGKKWVKGVVLGAKNDTIKSYNLNVIGQNQNLPSEKEKLTWSTSVKNQTTILDDKNSFITIFSEPKYCTHIEVDFPNSHFPLTLDYFSILQYTEFEIKDFNIDDSGILWIIDKAGRILVSNKKIGASMTLISHNTGGIGTRITKANSFPYTIDKSGNAWYGLPNGWKMINHNKKIIDITVDPKTEVLWGIDSDNKILKYSNNKWNHYGGQGRGKFIRVHNNNVWVIGTDNRLWKNYGGSNWDKMLNTVTKGFTIDPTNGKIWFIDNSNKIKSWVEGSRIIVPHPVSEGRAKKINLYNGIPYVIGMDNTIWKSIGNNGWKRLNIFNNL